MDAMTLYVDGSCLETRRFSIGNLYIGLVHYPIMNKHKDVITTAITNYDIHDIARASITYDVSKYFVIHNIPAQRELVRTIMEHWKSGFGSTYNPDRKRMLSPAWSWLTLLQ